MPDPMICPQCQVEMNHHCDKLVYGSNEETEGGQIQEFHTCPSCGECGSRESEN